MPSGCVLMFCLSGASDDKHTRCCMWLISCQSFVCEALAATRETAHASLLTSQRVSFCCRFVCRCGYRPLDVVRERTKNEAAWMGGCFLSGCIPANSCSAVELPDGVNIQLFDQPDFKGYTINLQGPLQVPSLYILFFAHRHAHMLTLRLEIPCLV